MKFGTTVANRAVWLKASHEKSLPENEISGRLVVLRLSCEPLAKPPVQS